MSAANCELDDNDSSDGQFGTDFVDASVSSNDDSSHNIIDERNGEEVHQLRRKEFNENDSYDLEAKQTLRVDGTIFDQEEILQKTYAKLRKHVKEYFLKLLIVGEIATGKTSFINRYVHNHFSSKYRATIGLDFALKVLDWDQNTIVRLQLWDIAGQERFGTMTRVYYKDAVGAFVVFDISRKQSFDQIIKWKTDLDAKVCLPDGNPLPSVLLANKCDLNDATNANAVNASTMDQFCEKHKFAGWFYTSAKDNTNVHESANFLIGKVLEKHTLFLDSWRMNSDTLSLQNSSYNPERGLNSSRCNC